MLSCSGGGEKAAFLCHSRAFAFHKRAYEPVVTASMPQGSLAGRTEDHRLAASLQVEQAVACAVVCLRWHVGVVEDARHHLREFPGRLSGTLYVLAGAQSPVLARVACKVLLHDGVLAFGMVSWVRCDEFPRPRRFSRASVCRPRGPFWRYAGTARCSSAGRVPRYMQQLVDTLRLV